MIYPEWNPHVIGWDALDGKRGRLSVKAGLVVFIEDKTFQAFVLAEHPDLRLGKDVPSR